MVQFQIVIILSLTNFAQDILLNSHINAFLDRLPDDQLIIY